MHYGLDTSDYTFGYIAGWSSGKEVPELSASLTTIQKTANEIISGIDEQLAELEKDKQQFVTNDKEKVKSVDGFTELPKKEATEGAKVFEQKDKSADVPTVDELEKKAKSGKSISLMDLAAATKREQSGQKGKSAEKKPSIRKQLAENKAKSEKTKAAPTKKKEDLSL